MSIPATRKALVAGRVPGSKLLDEAVFEFISVTYILHDILRSECPKEIGQSPGCRPSQPKEKQMVHLKKAGEELNTVQSMIANGYILTIEEVEMLSVLDSRLKEFRQKLIRQMREHNRPVKDIAHLFGLSSSRVSQICKPK